MTLASALCPYETEDQVVAGGLLENQQALSVHEQAAVV